MDSSREDRRARLEEIESLESRIAASSALCSVLDHDRLALIRRFDEICGWGEQGARSCAHWLSWRLGITLGTAREQVRVARALAALPETDAVFGKGKLSFSQVRALTRVASREDEAKLLEIARHSTASQLERLCRTLGKIVDPTAPSAERFVRRRDLDSGMVQIEARLRPEEAAAVEKAIEVAIRRAHEALDDGVKRAEDASSERVTHTRSVSTETRTRADAFVGICEAFLASTATGSSVPSRFEVHVSAETLADDEAVGEVEGGSPVSVETVRRLACDAPVVEGGRRTRRVSASLRRALEKRDRCCRFPGCTNRLFVDAHHVKHWSKKGPTTLENLALVCRYHHVLLHEGGFKLEKQGDTLMFSDPRGRVIDAVPEPAPPLEDWPLAEEGVNDPLWDGSRMDYGWTVACLLQEPARLPRETVKADLPDEESAA